MVNSPILKEKDKRIEQYRTKVRLKSNRENMKSCSCILNTGYMVRCELQKAWRVPPLRSCLLQSVQAGLLMRFYMHPVAALVRYSPFLDCSAVRAVPLLLCT